ncbi:hypothetical protein [Pseudomonas sp. UBA6310]|uniref:hypothetical protein n=1 Tax=Pseudomonas sp. UBA6310 TaxID=1947327 RepID=UPI002580B45A|nr:hypothetical protein [Pseudomonas sp. UBA6310]
MSSKSFKDVRSGFIGNFLVCLVIFLLFVLFCATIWFANFAFVELHWFAAFVSTAAVVLLVDVPLLISFMDWAP